MTMLKLHNETWALALLPHWGGRVASLRVGALDIFTPVPSGDFDPLNWPRGGAYPLLPYSNRLRGARLAHAGQLHALPVHPAAAPHTLHGVSHTLAWDVLEHSAEQILIGCAYHGEHWPWPVRFEQRYVLAGNTLRLSLALTNLGTTPMPAGLGLHPYFQRHPGMAARFFVEKDWDIDEDYLPTGSTHTLDEAVVVPAAIEHELALYGSGWDGRLLLSYPGGALHVVASQPLTHFVAFAPVGAPYLCLEPVSHLADAFNTAVQDWPAQGTQIVEPGETLGAHLSFTWVPQSAETPK